MASSRETVERMVAMFRTGNLDDIDRTVADAYVDHQGLGEGRVRGRAGFEQVVRAARERMRDLKVSIEDLIEQRDRVVARLRWRGTLIDGTRVERETIDIVRVDGGLAAEHWGALSWSRKTR
ncbi:MAG TPA: nuclear transport factor 2 family protein [Candidatus Caenarcaniphilales bacterium]|nr:nuclear transport factor 2 family protein [Candidatus Caenarcaniphilales bacterium]